MAGRPKKLGPEDQARIIELRDRHGMTLSAIATEFSVGIATVSRICASGSGSRDAPSEPARNSEPDRSQGNERPAAAPPHVETRAKGPGPASPATKGQPDAEPKRQSDPGHGLNADVVAAPRESRPVLSLHNQVPGGQVPGGQAPKTARPEHSRPDNSGVNEPASGSANAKCAAIEIRDSSRAVAQALEQWRQTRAQEDYARVDKALADIRRALAKAEVELWTWQ